MPVPTVLSYAAAYFSLIIAAAVLLRDRQSPVHRVFAAGVLLCAAEELFRGFSYAAVLPDDVIYWQRYVLAVSVLSQAVWLAFSLVYARVNLGSFLTKWKWSLAAAGILPTAFVVIFGSSLFAGSIQLQDARWSIPLGWSGRVVYVFSLCVSVLVLFNLERTIRSSIGRIRWQIKFVALGVGGLFALRIYLASQALLFSNLDTGFIAMDALALLTANLFFALSLSRGRSLNVDVYLSTATIQNSLTVILAGIYLVAVGLLAQWARYLQPSQALPVHAFIVFIALTALAVLLLSNRLRRKLRLFVSRHFNRPVYDYRGVLMDLTQRTTSLVDANELSTVVSRMVSESLETLSVSVWLVDEPHRRLFLAGSTALSSAHAKELEKAGKSAPELIAYLQERPGCVDFKEVSFAWPKEIMEAAPEFFREFSMRYAVGLEAAGEFIGVMTLNDDRVGKEALCVEDLVLLETLAAQLAARLLNLRLSERLRHAKEVETFQAVSTFFVHDLKNLASRLSLTMQNFQGNFDNPEFRTDAVQMISASVTEVDDMCERLALLKKNIEPKIAPCDLNQLVAATLGEFKGDLKAELIQDFQPLPQARMDSEQIHKVLTNLILNANQAVNGNGVIRVATIHDGDTIGFAVRDNGCGMSQEFLEKRLFKPFQTTKKRGLGIGLFHSKLIVEAHRGTFEVNSTPGLGTEFRVILPIS